MLGPGERERTVALPPGTWFDFWSDEPHEAEVRVAAPLGRPPLFVRASAVLPRAEGEDLALHVYPPDGQAGGGVLYGDAGDGYGAHRVDRFELTGEDGALSLRWREEGDYPFPYAGVVLHLHGFEAQEIDVDGAWSPLRGARVAVEPFREVRLVGA